LTDLNLSIAVQVALGLNHAHMSDFIHGDIKSPNILISATYQVSGVLVFQCGFSVMLLHTHESLTSSAYHLPRPNLRTSAHAPGEMSRGKRPSRCQRVGGLLLWSSVTR
jgi:serine/threonine protein kinase